MAVTETPSPRHESLTRFAVPSRERGALAVLTSALPYLLLFTATYLTLGVSVPLTVALELVTAGFLVRTFVVFHDCTHGSLLPSKRENGIVGTVLGLLVLTPFLAWRHEHAVHHATSGDLDRRGIGDVLTLTVAEYQTSPWYIRTGYRLFRNPVVMFGLGPIFAMIIKPRLVTKDARRPRLRNSILITNIVIAAVFAALILLMGWQDFLIVWAPPAMLAGSAGIWLFYVQHQFEETYWQSNDQWSYADAALRGSSHLKLPAVLQYLSANIGLHHVHHLNARIPHYNLPAAHRASPLFASVPELTMMDGVRTIRLKLWDEDARRLVTFGQARRRAMPAVAPARA